MRILVLAATAADRRLLSEAVEALGHELAAAVGPPDAARIAPFVAADLAILAAPSEAAAGALLERLRGAIERPLAAVEVLPAGSARLRLAPREDGVVAIARRDLATGLGDALTRLEPFVHGRARPRRVRLRLDAERALLTANGRSVHLTRSECAIAGELLAQPGEVVAAPDLASAVWRARERPTRVRTALRTHVYTLRSKLAMVAPEARIENVVNVGYRLRTSEGAR